MPLISVVIPVYNVEGYLEDTIASVKAQSVGDWELILVDDGSTDRSSAICDAAAAADSRIRTIHQPNAGQGPARNRGLDAATGRYLFYLDSDDTIATDTFARFVATTEAEEADVVFCGFHMVGNTPAAEPYDGDSSLRRFATPQEAQDAFLTRRCRFLTPGTFYRLAWLRDNSLRFKAVPYSEDIYNLWECLMTPGRFAYLGAPLYHYLCRPGSIMTGTRLPRILEGLPAFKALAQKLDESPAVSPTVKRHMLSRWILGICRSGARLCDAREFATLGRNLDARRHARQLLTFPEPKARLLALLYLLSPRLFHRLLGRRGE